MKSTRDLQVSINRKFWAPDGTEHFGRGWPKSPTGMASQTMSMHEALTRRFPHPAYFVAYEPTSLSRRLDKSVLTVPGALEAIGGAVVMHLALIDVDFVGHDAAHNHFWEEEKPRLEALIASHPGLIVYRSVGGYRILGAVQAFPIATAADAKAWGRMVVSWIAYLRRRFGLGENAKFDQLTDWTRYQRVPHDRRKQDGPIAELEVLGDVEQLGFWDPEFDPTDVAAGLAWKPDRPPAPERKRREQYEEGADEPLPRTDEPAFLQILRARGTRCEQLGPHEYDVDCPSPYSHSPCEDGKPFVGTWGKTKLYTNSTGPGHFHCLSAGCGSRYPGAKEQWTWFTPEEHQRFGTPEVDQALDPDPDFTPEPMGVPVDSDEQAAFVFDRGLFSAHQVKRSWAVPASADNLKTLLACHPGWLNAVRHNLMTDELELRHIPDRLNHYRVVVDEVAGVGLLTERNPEQCVTNETLADYVRAGLKPGPIDIDRIPIASWAGTVLYGRPNPDAVLEALFSVAEPYHPVREYLEGLPAWDGVQRAESFVVDLMGAEDTPVTRAYCRKWLISGVARAMQPGCKVDHVLVLASQRQGLRKSTMMAELCAKPDEWFSDSVIEPGDKDSYQLIQSVWLYEFSELDRVSSKDVERLKCFLTSRADKFRPPYARGQKTFPRGCFFGGTINAAHTYLTDDENRRFWTVTVTRRFEAGAVAAIRDQLWAEALRYYQAGETWWLEAEIEEDARSEQATRVDRDPWAEMLELQAPALLRQSIMRGQPGLKSRDLLARIYPDGDASKMKPGDSRRLARCMKLIGFVYQKCSRRGEHRNMWFYVLPEGHPGYVPPLAIAPEPEKPAEEMTAQELFDQWDQRQNER